MFLKREYHVRQIEVNYETFYQVVCIKDWGKNPSSNGIVGVSRPFKHKEHAERFLNMLEATQKARAKNYVAWHGNEKLAMPVSTNYFQKQTRDNGYD